MSEKFDVVVGKFLRGRWKKFRQPCVVVLRHASYMSEKGEILVTVYLGLTRNLRSYPPNVDKLDLLSFVLGGKGI
jgi:hypothetical protein